MNRSYEDPFIYQLFFTIHQFTSYFYKVLTNTAIDGAGGAEAKSFLRGLLAHLIIVPAWVIPPGRRNGHQGIHKTEDSAGGHGIQKLVFVNVYIYIYITTSLMI